MRSWSVLAYRCYVDINALSTENPLESAIKNRLYSLLPVFIALGSTALRKALHIAVSHGDDRAVEVLLRLTRAAAPDEGVLQCVEEALVLAQQLRFAHIEKRLRLALDIVIAAAVEGDERAVIDTSFLVVMDEFLPCNPTSPPKSTCQQRFNGTADFSSLEHQQVMESSTTDAEDNSSKPDVARLCECAIDRVDIADLDANRFRQEYASLNRAVSIRGTIGSDTAARWTVDSLLRDFGHIEVLRLTCIFDPSEIAYGTLHLRW